jgi:hypothetical protein
MMRLIALAAIAALFVTTGAEARYYSCRSTHSCASHGYYHSSDGYRVHGPDYNAGNFSAHCADGTLSHSRHARGTCSHHGGVE